MNKRKCRLAALLMALVMLAGTGGIYSVSADTKSELQSKLAELEKKEQQIKKSLSGASSSLSASQQRKNLLDSQIDNVQEQIDLLDRKLSSINGQINTTETQINQAEQEIAAGEESIRLERERLGQRLRAVMKRGNMTAFQMLWSTNNYTDYLLKSKVVQCVAEQDQAAIDELQESLADLNRRKAELQEKKTELAAQKKEVASTKSSSDSKKRQLDTLYKAAQTEVRNLQSTVSGYNKQLQDTQKLIEQANNEITRLINGNTSTGQYNGKMMYWPVPTVRAISSIFGTRWGTVHRGIDIANGKIPIYGENIVAAADGTVILSNYTNKYGSGWSYGYGYCCVIDHGQDSKGRNVTTLYAHCSAMYARVGQKVVGGKTVIAKAGNTGNVTGPHLHFEVRLDGKSVDPLYTYVDPKIN